MNEPRFIHDYMNEPRFIHVIMNEPRFIHASKRDYLTSRRNPKFNVSGHGSQEHKHTHTMSNELSEKTFLQIGSVQQRRKMNEPRFIRLCSTVRAKNFFTGFLSILK